MALLFLIRHGLTEQTGTRLYGRTPGVHLSDRGREQADGLASRLADVKLTALYSSPLERCLETAAPLAVATRLRIVERDDLLEVDYGAWTGRTLAALSRTKLWKVVQEKPSDARFPGGESLTEVQERAVAEIHRIERNHARGRVAVVSHGDVIRLLVSWAAGAPIDAFQRIGIGTASVSVIGLGSSGTPRLLLMNETGGLGGFASAKRSRPRVRG